MEIGIPYQEADMTKGFNKTIRGMFSTLDS